MFRTKKKEKRHPSPKTNPCDSAQKAWDDCDPKIPVDCDKKEQNFYKCVDLVHKIQ